ncbi:conserved hypothetical protein [Tenacibaculum sp. 190524A05c]|uniref:hypothetical protein n=1 Tax=Tenacibaculum platacis TaxID=3137852 RepID=UPI0031FBA184
MKKSILNLGKTLRKEEQQNVFGGIDKIKKLDPNCENIVTEGTCWTYDISKVPDHIPEFNVEKVGGGVNGSGFQYHYPCTC